MIYLLLLLPFIDLTVLFCRCWGPYTLRYTDKNDPVFLYKKLINLFLEALLSICIIAGAMLFLYSGYFWTFGLYYALNALVLFIVFSDIFFLADLLVPPKISLGKDLQLEEDIFYMSYVIIVILMWPITRFIFIKPAYSSEN